MKRNLRALMVLVATLLLNDDKNWAQDRPNIILILIDDLGWADVGYMGSKYYETPNIDKLANQGMIFTNAYSNAANCAPSRASLLSGQYTPRHGIYTVGNPARGPVEKRRLIPVPNPRVVPLEKITIAEVLKTAGYVSAAIGKWHIGNSPAQQGFDYELDRPELGYDGGHYDKNGNYLTEKLTQSAEDFIRQNQDRPFFLYLSHHAVHTPIEAKDSLIVKYVNKTTDGCHRHATYAAMIESVDASVGKINKTLEDLKLTENTLLIFFSDNGGHGTYTCQEPLRGGKGMFYEGGIRVPMFAYWPSTISPGSKCDVPVIGTDFYTTFLEISGATAPNDYPLDGENILPLLKGANSMEREAIYWHFPAYLEAYEGLRDASRDSIFRTRPVSVMRMGNWKLMLFHEEWILDGNRLNVTHNNSIELYNLQSDPGEKINLSQSEIKKRDELVDHLNDWLNHIQAPIPMDTNPGYQPGK